MTLKFFENLASSTHYSDLSEIQDSQNLSLLLDINASPFPFANETHVFEIM